MSPLNRSSNYTVVNSLFRAKKVQERRSISRFHDSALATRQKLGHSVRPDRYDRTENKNYRRRRDNGGLNAVRITIVLTVAIGLVVAALALTNGYEFDSGSDEVFQAMHKPRRPITLDEICAGIPPVKKKNHKKLWPTHL